MGDFLWSSDPRFYYRADDAASTASSIQLSEALTRIDLQPMFHASTQLSAGFGVSTSFWGQARSVRITFERFYDRQGTRQARMVAMINHLQRGGWVAFSGDHARTWASRCTSPPGAGDTSIVTAGNLFSALSGSAAIGADDHMIFQSPNPDAKYEECIASAWTGGTSTITLAGSNEIKLDHTATTLVRWVGFFPRLVLRPDARDSTTMLTDEYMNTYTLDLPLMTAPILEHASVAA